MRKYFAVFFLMFSTSLYCQWDSESNISGWVYSGTTVSLSTTTDNVGIGTASPTEPLHVSGHARFDNVGIGSAAANGSAIVMAGGSDNTRISGNGYGTYIDFGYNPSASGGAGDLSFNSGTVGATQSINLEITGATGTIKMFTGGTQRFNLANDGGIVVGAATGGSQGAGTLNAVGVYDDGVIVSDYVFEGEYIEDQLPSIDEMTQFYTENKHLSTIPGKKEWEKDGKPSLGKLQTSLYKTIEHQAVYISQLNKRLKVLEDKMSSK